MLIKTSRKAGARIHEAQSLADEFVAKEISRRRMVQGVMIASMASLLGCATKTVDASGAPAPAPSGDPAASGGDEPVQAQHLVGMGWHDTDRDAALQAALAETIGLGMIKAGESVYLRVNSNSGDPYPYSTSPKTIIAVGGMLRDIGVTDIRVGDRSFWGDQDTAGNLAANGITAAAKKIGTTAEVYDDNVDWTTLPPESVPNWKGTVRIPAPVTSADHIIVLSCVKTHFIATITMSLKICLGLVHADDRARDGNLKTHDTKILFKQVAQINKAFTPSLIIADGYSAVISGGPTVNDKPPGAPSTFKGGVTGDPKVFIVSTDRIAADVTGIAVLQKTSPAYELVNKTKPFANPVIKEAIAAGIGISGPSAYDLSGPTVPMIDDYRALVTG